MRSNVQRKRIKELHRENQGDGELQELGCWETFKSVVTYNILAFAALSAPVDHESIKKSYGKF